MPTTRKKVIKTVYKHDDSDVETGDFSDSGSDAHISEPPSSDEDEIEANRSSADEFDNKPSKKRIKQPPRRKTLFAKELITKINKQATRESEDYDDPPTLFTVKDLTDADKLLPSSLHLSESDSSDDETPRPAKLTPNNIPATPQKPDPSDSEKETEYTDVWSNIHDNSAELAKKAFQELEQHNNAIEKTKASLENYALNRKSTEQEKDSNVKDLLALGEEVEPTNTPAKIKRKIRKAKDDSDSEVDDWEEVKESKGIPQQGLQLVVALPDSVSRKTKKIDVEMMMKRKMNRVKKENQVFMHKVHVLCWLGHGNYVNRVLNDQEILGVVLGIVPKGCYPKERLDMKYVEQITSWYKDKFIVKPDKHENKFRPKAPPLKTILLDQIKKRAFTSKKYLVFVFVAMLRALGLQCRVMFNFVTLPLKPSSSELCSLSIKTKEENNQTKSKVVKDQTKSKSDKNQTESKDVKDQDKSSDQTKPNTEAKSKTTKSKTTSISKSKQKLAQVDGVYDYSSKESDSEFENIMQLDGNDDGLTKTRSLRSCRTNKNNIQDEDVSPPKRAKTDTESKNTLKPHTNKRNTSKSPQPKNKNEEVETGSKKKSNNVGNSLKSPRALSLKKLATTDKNIVKIIENEKSPQKIDQVRKTRNNSRTTSTNVPSKTLSTKSNSIATANSKSNGVKILITNEDEQSHYFKSPEQEKKAVRSTRKRSHTAETNSQAPEVITKTTKAKSRTKSEPGTSIQKSKYFDSAKDEAKKRKVSVKEIKKEDKLEDNMRVSHRDLTKSKVKPKNDVTQDLIHIVKNSIKNAKEEGRKGHVKRKVKKESDEDSDYLPVEDTKNEPDSDGDFKPTKISPRGPKISPGVKPSTSKKIDRRVFSTDDELKKQDELEKSKKVDVWCEIFVEELEQWIPVDIVKGKIHCAADLYSHASHPVCYVVGWDNNNYLKDLTRRYVPHWNTVTRKQRADPEWWKKAVQPWLGPRNARDKEEDDALDRMQMEAPLPKSIAEYKNHPLYALKRHLLKFEALYPPDAATLGFVRNEPVYARECVYICRSRDIWLKEAKVVKLGEKPYKIVKARPKWDRLSNKLITDKPLEVFGPWQVQDYEPPTAENGIVPRNAYGNVELFKECMLPKGTVHIKLPGLNKVAKKLNIDCAPAMIGFDFNGGWSHPVYDGFVVCKEFEEIITEAWLKDQEEQERREVEKLEQRVYGNWKRLIKGLLIKERLKLKYGFEEPTTSKPKNKASGPRLVVKKK